MREVPDAITGAWHRLEFTGERRPMARVTIAHPDIQLFKVPDNTFARTPFMESSGDVKEIPWIKSVSWDRSWDSPIAECTIEVYNTRPNWEGSGQYGDVDLPGSLAYNYGAGFSSFWDGGRSKDPIWQGRIMPDQIVWTYEGYGVNPDVSPELDEHLVMTGVWLVDEVDMTSDGMITLRCRDLGRLLQDHILFPPVVPFSAGPRNDTYPKGAYSYPLTFSSRNDEPTITTTKGDIIPYSASRIGIKWDNDSNEPYVGYGGAVYGHRGRDAMDASAGTYWLSVGNLRGDQGYSYEWVQAKFAKQTVSEVRFRTKFRGYRAYISVYADGQWVNRGQIPYDPNNPASAPNGSNIPFVTAATVPDESWQEVTFAPVENATRVRLTLGNLPDTNIGTYQHRAAVRELQVFGGSPERRAPDTVEKIHHFNKNYDDYTDIIKLLLAWGGFYWDRNDQRSFATRPEREGDEGVGGGSEEWQYSRADPFLKYGRIWGDLEQTGTAGPAELSVDVFDKKPIIEAIEYIRDIVGFIFIVDEYGGAVWKLPNVFARGNTQRTPDNPHSGARTAAMVSLFDWRHILDLRSTISSRNIRERTFISSTNAEVGAMAAGWNPNPTGLRRVGGWTDQNFATNDEAQVMADMIALRQLFTYRSNQVTIPAYPRIQVDDQIRIYERMTSESYVHYVKGISSTNDLASGEWTYTLDTHWLGERPFTQWVFDVDKLASQTRRWLRNLFGATT